MSETETNSRFTPDEWETLTEAPFLIGLAISDADINANSSSRELDAMLRVCGEARDNYPDNALIQEVLDRTGWFSDMDEPEADAGEIATHFEKVAALVDGKAPGDEGKQFKQFLFDVGLGVARAYSEEYFGLGKKISNKERQMLESLKTALGLPDAVIK